MTITDFHNSLKTSLPVKLPDLISWLSSQDQTRRVDFGFASAHIGQGPFPRLVFTPRRFAKIGDMLSYAKHALNSAFHDCDGNSVTATSESSVHIGYRGQNSLPITEQLLLSWSFPSSSHCFKYDIEVKKQIEWMGPCHAFK